MNANVQLPPFFKENTRHCPACAISVSRASECRHWREKHSGPREDFLLIDPQIDNKFVDKARVQNGIVQFRLCERSISTTQIKKTWFDIDKICGSNAVMQYATNPNDLTRSMEEINIIEGDIVTRYLSELINFKTSTDITDQIFCSYCQDNTPASLANVWVHENVPTVPHHFCNDCMTDFKIEENWVFAQP